MLFEMFSCISSGSVQQTLCVGQVIIMTSKEGTTKVDQAATMR